MTLQNFFFVLAVCIELLLLIEFAKNTEGLHRIVYDQIGTVDQWINFFILVGGTTYTTWWLSERFFANFKHPVQFSLIVHLFVFLFFYFTFRGEANSQKEKLK